MRPISRSRLTRYGTAILTFAVALMARMLLDPFLGDHHLFVTFYVAVAAAAWYGGFGPSLMTLVLSLVAVPLYFISTRGSFALSLPVHWADLVTYLFVGGMIGLFSEAMGRAQRHAETKALEAVEKQTQLELEIAERKRLEHELKMRADELANADRCKDEFLAMLGHELRNPLAPICNAVQILRLENTSEPNRANAREIIDHQVGQMARLVDDLLDVSRISRGKIRLQKKVVELAEIIERAVENSRPLIASRKQELIESLPGEPVWLEADPVRLAQVIANLLNNSAKYTGERGHIWLSAQCMRNEAIIRVRDDGKGIAPAMLPHVFDLFAQADRTLEQSQGGLGIGLALVKNLVEMHGGSVHALSDGLDKGSEFIVRLSTVETPAIQSDSGPRNVHRERPPYPARRILVVDDNVDAANSLALLLEFQGNEVRAAHDGPTALRLASAWRPDIVLMDIGLPGMDGNQTARLMRQQPGLADALLIAITGYGQEDDRRRLQEAGFDHHLIKPVGPDVLQPLMARSRIVAR